MKRKSRPQTFRYEMAAKVVVGKLIRRFRVRIPGGALAEFRLTAAQGKAPARVGESRFNSLKFSVQVCYNRSMTDTLTTQPPAKTRQTKVCTQCQKRKAVRSKFRWMPGREAYHAWCRDCERESSRLRAKPRKK